MTSVMCEDGSVREEIFDRENLPKELREAQDHEMAKIVPLFKALRQKLGRPLKILDIGIGDGRVPLRLKEELAWDLVSDYLGIDNTPECIQDSVNKSTEAGLNNVRGLVMDAKNLSELQESDFDVVLCTWFTPGNFVPDTFDRQDYIPSSLDLSQNNHFTQVFMAAYDKLSEGGMIILGSIYNDNESTRLIQKRAYEHFGWKVITDERDSFAATDNGWFSQRFTRERILSYLPNIDVSKFEFLPLDNEDFATMVLINK